ncbi:MAG TPA: FAD-dependent oxidoreductase [Candidatus Dormibacteraeota bacterium]|nr:FAD-dependent oxidoreductase [Candidatus Dormibacteraeota bacterium]
MLRRDVVVVGAGVSGLTLAGEVARRASVTVIDRLPAVGGVLGYEDPLVRELHEVTVARQVELLLGTTALRWVDNRLLVAGPRGIEWIPAGCLVFCGGTRPSTAAELGIGGDRPAGVFSASVAIHLMEAGVRLGNSVVVVGSSDWAARAAFHLDRQGTHAAVVLDQEEPRFGERHWCGWRLLEVHGAARVSHVLLARDGFRQRIACDAVVLGARLKPLRNVDGAVFEGPNVIYLQAVAEVTTARRVEAFAREASGRVLAGKGGTG